MNYSRILAMGVLALPMATAHAQVNPWIEIAERIGLDSFCRASFVAGTIPNLRPASQDERFALNLRCEAKGGKDEMTKKSCCEHLTVNDAKNIGVCPDNPVNVVVPIREAFKLVVKC
ncbi:hypothetical protein [Variovorax rhizosphaerae]|uniref:Uncharacterized protein n=1 Tax=Variovorax rhizosphaerae TaxID=1836200 RepID=A0ABU8WSZ6_9BURK